MRKKHEHYSEEEKLHLLHSYYQSGMSKTSFCKQHGISGITLLNKKALAFSRLETEARDLMITRAEEYFNIPIRKKPGAK